MQNKSSEHCRSLDVLQHLTLLYIKELTSPPPWKTLLRPFTLINIPPARNRTCCLHVSTSYFISQLSRTTLRLAYRTNKFVSGQLLIYSSTHLLTDSNFIPNLSLTYSLPDNVENCGPTIPPRLSPYLLHLSSYSSFFQRRQRLVRLCGYRRPSNLFCLTRLLWLQCVKPDYYW